MTAATITAADLRPVDLFEELSDEELAEWAGAALPLEAAPGEIIAEQASEPRGMMCLLDGRLQTFVRAGDRLEPVAHMDAPTWVGAIASLSEGPIGARMVAVTACRLALVPGPEFRRLALAYPTVHRRIMRQVGPVMARVTAIEQNRERLAALGTMAAGLAHELNNPAAAASRSAEKLAEALDVVGSTLRQFVEAGIERDEAARIVALQDQAVEQARARTALQALDAADAEEAMLARLEGLGVPEAWRLAEPLAEAGVGVEWLEQIHDLAGPATSAALGSVAATLSARALADELRESTTRMKSLVGAVKSYAYMDRGGVVKADIHEGLETTVTVLAHKIKHTEIKIDRDYDRTLPALTMHGSELNQVWTNLLDNAIDALGDRGRIAIGTARDGDCIRVRIADDGPGIPPEIRDRVFEPFFTTKDVGQGTGLGLDTARRIVQERHGGTLSFASGETGTTFTVWLPFEQPGP